VPHLRNPFFTGREDVLTQLRDALTAGSSAALTQATSPQAISGMGGIGKTQTAVEYAYRHRDEYQAVLWASAVDETTLREGFVEIARLLGLPQAQEADQDLAVQAVKAWLETTGGWLLILDNADEPKTLKPFLPLQKKGHVLLTTRAFALGALAQKVEIRKLAEDDGALLLLRRAWPWPLLDLRRQQWHLRCLRPRLYPRRRRSPRRPTRGTTPARRWDEPSGTRLGVARPYGTHDQTRGNHQRTQHLCHLHVRTSYQNRTGKTETCRCAASRPAPPSPG